MAPRTKRDARLGPFSPFTVYYLLKRLHQLRGCVALLRRVAHPSVVVDVVVVVVFGREFTLFSPSLSLLSSPLLFSSLLFSSPLLLSPLLLPPLLLPLLLPRFNVSPGSVFSRFFNGLSFIKFSSYWTIAMFVTKGAERHQLAAEWTRHASLCISFWNYHLNYLTNNIKILEFTVVQITCKDQDIYIFYGR